jgi:hypothetical protein
MRKLFNFVILILISVIFTGCHFIEDDKDLIVIEKRMSDYTNYKYHYEVKNPATIANIDFYSNRNFEIGDTLKLEVD